MSLVIDFQQLFVLSPYSNHLPLSHFDQDRCAHIHGKLIIIWRGQRIKTLGNGLQDCCFNNWINALSLVKWELRAPHSSFIYFDYDQNQPDYQFVRKEDELYLSLVRDARKKPYEFVKEWKNVKVSYSNF
ncbi:MAG: hypothetical protein AAF985_20100 [Bacteroidota bacterium]